MKVKRRRVAVRPPFNMRCVDARREEYVIIRDNNKCGTATPYKLRCRNFSVEVQDISFLVKSRVDLQSVSFVSCRITAELLSSMLEDLSNNCSNLTSIDLSYNHIGSAGALLLSKFVLDSKVRHLNLSHVKLCDVTTFRGENNGRFNTGGVCTLLQSCLKQSDDDNDDGNCSAVQSLDISGNMLGQNEDLMASLCDAIERNSPVLKWLNLGGNLFSQEDILRLMESSKRNSHIISYCSRSDLLHSNMNSYKNNAFQFQCCNLTYYDTYLMAMSGIQTCATADFSCNIEFGNGDLNFPPTNGLPFVNLQTLHLVDIGMNCSFAMCLREVLENPSCCLTSLDVSRNSLTLNANGFNHLLSGMKDNKSVKYLSLKACIPKNYVTYHLIKETIESNTSLLDLDLSDSTGCKFDATQLVSSLCNNSTLEVLRLSHCEIDSDGLTSLRDMIDKNRTLTCLDLSRNHIGEPLQFRSKSIISSLFSIPLTSQFNVLQSSTCCMNEEDEEGVSRSPNTSEQPLSPLSPAVHSKWLSPLKEINLSHNDLSAGSSKAVVDIGRALRNDYFQLETLDMSFCAIPGIHNIDFGTLLCGVKNLVLRGNKLEKAGLQSILRGMCKNRCIRSLNLSKNATRSHESSNAVVLNALEECLSANRHIEHIDLRQNNLFDYDHLLDSNNQQVCTMAMRTLGHSILANAEIGGNLRSLNILQNIYPTCREACLGNPIIDWLPDILSRHSSCVEFCPALCLHYAVTSMKRHPTMESLCGIDSAAKSLRVDVGKGRESCVMWALFSEISRHQNLKRLDVSRLVKTRMQGINLSEWFASNSLIRVLKWGNLTYHNGVARLDTNLELSMMYRVGVAVFVRGCTILNSETVCRVIEYIYGEGLQSLKFLKYIMESKGCKSTGIRKLS